MENTTIFQGRLTAAPELKKTQSDIAYLNFTVAWSEKYKEVEFKCFLNCKAWRQTAEFIARYFTKGSPILVRGRLLTETWKDKDGNNRSATVLEVEKAHFCGSSPNAGQNQGQVAANTASASAAPQFEVVDDDALPF